MVQISHAIRVNEKIIRYWLFIDYRNYQRVMTTNLQYSFTYIFNSNLYELCSVHFRCKRRKKKPLPWAPNSAADSVVLRFVCLIRSNFPISMNLAIFLYGGIVIYATLKRVDKATTKSGSVGHPPSPRLASLAMLSSMPQLVINFVSPNFSRFKVREK